MFIRAIQITLFVIFTTVFLSAEIPSQKPNFSGTWKFNPKKTSLQNPLPSSSVFIIKHEEPKFSLSRIHVFEGESNTWSIDLTTDGKEVVQKDKSNTFVTRLYWDGSILVLDGKIILKDKKEVSNIVRYSLSEDGNIFTASERMRGPKIRHDNIWVFDRESK